AQSEYPKREQFFAQRFIRLLSKTCAAQEIGVDAVWLLTVIASQEDAARYKRAVTFYNDQLRSICGFGTWRRLDNARKRAMESGWLHYEPCDAGKRRAGRYWVSIPSFAEDLDDSAISEPPHIHYVECAQGQTEKAGDTMPSAHSEAHSEAHNEAHNYLTLTLIPNPKEECFAAQSYTQKPT